MEGGGEEWRGRVEGESGGGEWEGGGWRGRVEGEG